MNNIHIILLSGGSGTRLWPLSSEKKSKQFLKVLRDKNGKHISMVQRTFSQITRLIPNSDITVATCEEQVAILREQVGKDTIVAIEPERRDTAPAIMLACEHLVDVQKADPSDIIIVLPIDSYVEDDYFLSIKQVVNAVKDRFADLVLLGVEPTYPSEKYGYIVPSVSVGSPRRVVSFSEKPSRLEAEQLIKKGALWNNCVFGFKLSYMIKVISKYVKYKSYSDLSNHYSELPKNSFDYEIVEHASSIGVIPYHGSWKDLGTWNTLTEEMCEPTSGLIYLDKSTCSNTHAINELKMPLIVAGIEDAIIVATESGILVSSKKRQR